jgi:dTDP-4-amino-4,6-dideoxy-D-galactose acyltransferase
MVSKQFFRLIVQNRRLYRIVVEIRDWSYVILKPRSRLMFPFANGYCPIKTKELYRKVNPMPDTHVEILPWDSDFLGFTVGKLNISKLNKEQLRSALKRFWESGGKLVYWSSDPNDNTSKEAASFNNGSLVDIKTTYTIQMNQLLSAHGDAELYCGSADDPGLEALALQAGEYSRFKLDNRMPKDAYVRLYSLWMRKSILGERADAVLVRRDSNRILAVITVTAQAERGTIELLAVDSQVRNQGLGHDIILSSFAWFKEHGCKQVRVDTQSANEAACRLYERSGFTVELREAYYHFWKEAV